MKYPVLSHAKLRELVRMKNEGTEIPLDTFVQWIGEGDSIDLRALEAFASELAETDFDSLDGSSDKDRIEGLYAIRLFNLLKDTPVEVLDDKGFWRYLGFVLFWDFIAWRESEPFARGNEMVYLDAKAFHESVLPRMFLRVKALGLEESDQRLSSEISKAGDFWRSHVIRVRTGAIPVLAKAVVRRQSVDRLVTEKIRPAAKMVNRMHSNVLFNIYEDAEVDTIVANVWAEVQDK